MAESTYKHFVPPVPVNPDYEKDLTTILIENLDQLKESFEANKGMLIAWDTETTGLNPEESSIVGFSYSTDGKTGYYCPVNHFDLALGKPALDLFYNFLRESKASLLYNARFDIRIMEYSGYDMSFLYPKDITTGRSHALFCDVMNQVWLSDTNVPLPSLKASTLRFLGYQPPKFLETLGDEQNFRYVPAKDAYRYACFTDDTLIQTKQGLKQIKDLVPYSDFIKTATGYNKLLAVLDQGVKKTIKVTTPIGHTFTCTPDHLFAGKIDDKLVWVKAKNLDVFPFFNLYRGGRSLNEVTEVWKPDGNDYSSTCKVEDAGTEQVFDLTIKDEHNFALQSGILAHNCLDAINTYNLFKVTYKYYKESPYISKVDNACIYIIGQLEKQPLKMNTEYLVTLRDNVYTHVQELEKKIYAIAGRQFKIGSSRELTKVFIEQGIDTGERTKAGDMKTGIELLNLYLRNHPNCELLNLLIEYKEQFKFYNSYLKTLVEIAKRQEQVPPRFSYKLQSVPCLTENNDVYIRNKGLVSIKDVKEHDFIWTQYGFKRVLWANKHDTEQVIKLRLSNNLCIEGTPHHPVLINKGTDTELDLEWAILGDIKQGEHVVLNHHTPSGYTYSESEYSYYLQYLGFLTSYFIEPSVLELDEYNHVKHILNSYSIPSFKAMTEEFTSSNNINALIQLIKQSTPIDWIYYLSGLFYALFETKIYRNRAALSLFTIYSEHIDFLKFIQSILVFFGIDSSVTEELPYSLNISTDRALTLFKLWVVDLSQSEFLSSLFKEFNQDETYIEYADSVVVDKEQIDIKTTVYDIEVEDVHEYVANGIVTHNTGRFACCSANCLVPTNKGIKRIVDIDKDDRVDIGNSTFTKAELLDMGDKPVFNIQLENGMDIEVTDDHRFLTKTKDGLVWKYVKDIDRKDKLCTKYVHNRQYQRSPMSFMQGLITSYAKLDSDNITFTITNVYYITLVQSILNQLNLTYSVLDIESPNNKQAKFSLNQNTHPTNTILDRLINTHKDGIDLTQFESIYQAESFIEGYFCNVILNNIPVNIPIKHKSGILFLLSYIGITPTVKNVILNAHNKHIQITTYPSLPFFFNFIKEKSKLDTKQSYAYTHLTHKECIGIMPTYTLSVDHPSHQYYSNSLINHNCGKDGKNTYFAPINLQCLDENTLIKTQNGLIPIKNIKDGDLVWTGFEYAPCKTLGSKQKMCETVTTHFGQIKASLEHKFYVLDKDTLQPKWEQLAYCIALGHFPIRDKESNGYTFDQLINDKTFIKNRMWSKSISELDIKQLSEKYKDLRFDVIERTDYFQYPHLNPPLSTVYDLYVPNYNKFTANGFIVHNSLPKPKSTKCYGRKATKEEIEQKKDTVGWIFSTEHPEWSPGKVVEGMKQSLNVRSAFLPQHPENGDYIVSIDMCTEEGTPVQTKQGYKAISQLNIGDYVYSPYGFIQVIRVINTGEKKVVKINPDIEGKQALYCSEEHKLIIDNNKIEARYLTNTKVKTYSFNSPLSINNIFDTPQSDQTSAYLLGYILNKGVLLSDSKQKLNSESDIDTDDTSNFEYLNVISTNKQHLIRIADILGYNSTIQYYKSIDNEGWILSIHSHPLCQSLINLGFLLFTNYTHPQHTQYIDIEAPIAKHTTYTPNTKINPIYYIDKLKQWLSTNLRHFIRGIIDSIGNVHLNDKSLSISLTIPTSYSNLILDYASIQNPYIKDVIDIDNTLWKIKYIDSNMLNSNTLNNSITNTITKDISLTLYGKIKQKKNIYNFLYKNATIWNQQIRNIIDVFYIENFKQIYMQTYDITVNHPQHIYYLDAFLSSNCGEELRVVTNLFGEHSWAEVINNGGDLHHANSDAIYGKENYTKETRKKAKGAAFGMLYGQSDVGFQRKFPDMTLDEAKEFMIKFKKTIPNIVKGQQRMIFNAKKTGTFYSGFGRPRRVKHYLNSTNGKERSFGERTIMNGPIQSTAADVLKIEFMRLWDYVFTKYPEIKFVCTIHDEINFSVPRHLADEVIPILVQCMTVKQPNWLVTLDCSLSIGPSLGEQYPMKYNFETKEFVPDWEEDTRKESKSADDNNIDSDEDNKSEGNDELDNQDIDPMMFVF